MPLANFQPHFTRPDAAVGYEDVRLMSAEGTVFEVNSSTLASHSQTCLQMLRGSQKGILLESSMVQEKYHITTELSAIDLEKIVIFVKTGVLAGYRRVAELDRDTLDNFASFGIDLSELNLESVWHNPLESNQSRKRTFAQESEEPEKVKKIPKVLGSSDDRETKLLNEIGTEVTCQGNQSDSITIKTEEDSFKSDQDINNLHRVVILKQDTSSKEDLLHQSDQVTNSDLSRTELSSEMASACCNSDDGPILPSDEVQNQSVKEELNSFAQGDPSFLFVDADRKADHFDEVEKRKLLCNICGLVFDSIKHHKLHYQNFHAQQECPDCCLVVTWDEIKKIGTTNQLRVHRKTCPRDKVKEDFKCSLCQQGYPTRRKLENHVCQKSAQWDGARKKWIISERVKGDNKWTTNGRLKGFDTLGKVERAIIESEAIHKIPP